MNDSKEFAEALLDALIRRQRYDDGEKETMSKDELYDFWQQISDTGFDSRMQLFFDL